MSKNRVIAMRSGKALTVNVNGQSYYANFETKEESVEAYKEVMSGDKSNEDIERVKKFMSPSYRCDVDLNGILQKDRMGNYYLGNTQFPLPGLLLERFKEHLEDGITVKPLANFWRLLMLNPNEHVKKDLFRFMEHFRMPITDNGYFIGYKSVAFKGEKDRSLGIFISQQYVNKKAAGRSVEDCFVVESSEQGYYQLMTEKEIEEHNDQLVGLNYDHYVERTIREYLQEKFPSEFVLLGDHRGKQEDFFVAKGNLVPKEEDLKDLILSELAPTIHGNLGDMFHNLSSMFDYESPVFTDWHTQKSTIELGQPVSMDMKDVDKDPNSSCSTGLHIGTPEYTSSFGHGERQYILACLVNPMNVGAVPYDYDCQKMRVSEYLPYAICEMEDGQLKELETNYFEEDYINFEKEILETKLEAVDLDEEQELLIRERLVILES